LADTDDELLHLAQKREKEIMNRISKKFEENEGGVQVRDG